ncbi:MULTISPECIES: hypothetical protein [unclassified Exiguobacterium]|uniref:hypothetical protein n=1 Tax=unclassified Exiguobacterium TaxID=2644629 RepID=UPI001BEB3AA7|nr:MULTISPECIES: hypothetical protein [unclassified Exiguobacterium]
MFWRKQADVVMEDERSFEEVKDLEEMKDVHNHFITKDGGGYIGQVKVIDPIQRPTDY